MSLSSFFIIYLFIFSFIHLAKMPDSFLHEPVLVYSRKNIIRLSMRSGIIFWSLEEERLKTNKETNCISGDNIC